MSVCLRLCPLVFLLSSCILDFTDNIFCKHPSTIIDIDSCRAFLPNAFTPNKDGLNDVFRFQCNCPVESYDLVITSLTGRTLFETTDPAEFWDGTYESREIRGNVRYEVDLIINGQAINRKEVLSLIRYDRPDEIDLPHCEDCAFSDQWDARSGGLAFETLENLSCKE